MEQTFFDIYTEKIFDIKEEPSLDKVYEIISQIVAKIKADHSVDKFVNLHDYEIRGTTALTCFIDTIEDIKKYSMTIYNDFSDDFIRINCCYYDVLNVLLISMDYYRIAEGEDIYA